MNAYFICVIVCVQMWFVYAQLCDCTCSNVICVIVRAICVCLTSKPKKIFKCFTCFRKWFLSLGCWKFLSKCQNLCVEKLCVWPFCDCFREWFHITIFLRNFNFLKISSREFCKSLMSASQVKLDPWKSALCIYTFLESLTHEMLKNTVFRGLKIQFSKHLVFLHSTTPTLQQTYFLTKTIKTLLDFISKTHSKYF